MSAVPRMTARLLGRGLTGLVMLLVGVALFEVVQAPVIDSIGGEQRLTAILNTLPPAFQALARTRPEFIGVSGLAGYLSLGFTHPLYMVLTVAAVVGFAARSLAGEMERGTIQIALARPLSRPAVYAARVAGVVLICALLAIVGPLGMVAGLVASQPTGEVNPAHLAPLAVASFALFWAIGGLALLGSAAASSTGRVVGWAIAGLVVSYFLDYFADVWRILEPLRVLSVFGYYDPSQALVFGAVPPTNLLVLVLAGLGGTLAGLVVFTRRDLPA